MARSGFSRIAFEIASTLRILPFTGVSAGTAERLGEHVDKLLPAAPLARAAVQHALSKAAMLAGHVRRLSGVDG
ncbi:hypothetical protein X748_11995 [Mesorhizobium sp. LNJC386A00]|nr:hypothetical protein X752_17245 [Mesorhizobium sp. LNJC398B00]ESY36599.1 hypothetical protein X748_11995 [Mesorhizobium sp. LNJC386A00]